MNEATQDEITAYHEAGHAVMALALGRPIQQVTIEADAKRLGHCEIKKGTFRPNPDALETAILILLAGVAAEARHRGVYDWGGASQDLRDVRELCSLRASGQKQIERLERRMLDKAEHVLSQSGHWTAVERIAAELLRIKTVSGRAVRHFFEQAAREEAANR